MNDPPGHPEPVEGWMNKTIFNRFVFLFALYFLGIGGSVFLGQISCQDQDKGDDDCADGNCSENESSDLDTEAGADSSGTVTDPTTQTCAEFLADYDYVSGISECICVGAVDTSWCPQGDTTPASIYTTITDALASLTSGHSSVATLLAEEIFKETLSLTNANYSNTYFIGIGDSESDTTISYPSSSTPTVDSNVIKMDSTVSTIGVYNLTLNGIGTEAASFTSDQLSSEDNLEAATIYITDSTSISFGDVNLTDNYYRGLYSTGTITVESLDFASFTPGEGDTFGTTIAVWNEGTMTSTDYAFTIQDSTIDVGIVGSRPGHSFSMDGYLSEDVQVASMILRDSDSVTLSQISINNTSTSPLGIYSEDVETFTWNGVTTGAYSTLSDANFGLVGCQTDESASTSNSIYTFEGHTSGNLENLYFGTVKVTGSSNSDPSFDNIYTTSHTYVTSDFSSDVTIDYDEGNSYDCSLGTYAP